MTTIKILVTLEYLGPYLKPHCFGLTLQVASDADAVRQDDQLLRPWLWTYTPTALNVNARPQIQLWQYKENISLTSISSEPAGDPGLPDRGLLARLNGQFEALRTSGATNTPFGWTPDPQSKPERALPNQGAYRWPAQLAQASRYPYPIPHQLNLSYFISLNDPLPTTDFLVAAPIFIANKTRYTPITDSAPNGRNPDKTLTIAYKAESIDPTQPVDTAAPTVEAIVLPMDVAGCKLNIRSASSDTPIAKQDPYLSLPHPEDTVWQQYLIPLAAEFFDPSARLIGALRLVMPQNQVPGVNSPPRNSDYDALYIVIKNHFEDFRKSTVASLRNVADCGVQHAPGNVREGSSRTGPSLLDRVLGTWTKAQKASDQPKAQAFAANLVAILEGKPGQIATDAWPALLGKIPNLAGNPMLVPLKDPLSDSDLLGGLIALENLHLAFTQNEVLKGIVTAQWDYCCAPEVNAKLDGTLWRSFRQSADFQLTEIDLRHQLAIGNLGSNWDDVLSEMAKALAASQQTNSLSASKSALRAGLSSALCHELSNCLPSAQILPLLLKSLFNKTSCNAPAASSSWVDTQLQAIVKDAPDPKASSAKRQPTRVSEGITLALDTLSSQDSASDDPSDPLRAMVGLCVLARKSKSKEWKCLNFAMACLDREGTQPLTPNGTVIPIPLHNQAGLRNATITYNNRPLMGLSPDMQFGDPLTSRDTNRLIEYLHPSLVPNSHVDGKIPGLVFGSSYDFFVGIVRTSMAVPNLFADPRNPGILLLTTKDKNRLNDLEKVFTTHGLSTKYLRTVPVGELRFGNDKVGFNQKFGLPVIPPEVQPRARDLERTVLPRNGGTTPGTEPVILLTDYQPSIGVSEFVFTVFKPTTDIRTWDAWVAAKGMSPADRASIWADYHQQSNQQADGSSVRDTSIDDPAVDQLQVTVKWLDAQSSESTLNVVWPNAAGTNSLNSLRAGPVTIRVSVGAGTPSLSETSPNAVELRVAPGTLSRLTLTPTLRDNNLFANGINTPPNVGPSYPFLVETADTGKKDANGTVESALPSVTDLRSKLTASPSDDALTFALNVAADGPPKFRNIRYARLRLQSWRWDGRPCPQFPWTTSLGNEATQLPAELKAWEDTAFATRSVHDSSMLVMTMDSIGKTLRAIEDISGYRGVLYFRYSIEVFNRYGPLVPPSQRSVDSLGDDLTKPLWLRCLVPLRWRGEVPKPAVKLVLPLTSSLRPNKTASLMVVLQGPWYSIGGLAERMQAELLSTGASGQLAEVGPDPIRWTGTRAQLKASYSLGDTFDEKLESMHLDGPIGHTFDDSDTNPLWVNCSFVLPPIQTKDNVDTEWDLAKIRFRRVFDSAAPKSLPVEITSQPTDPYWVQFLPNYEYLNDQDRSPTAQAFLMVDRNATNLVITIKANNKPITFRKEKNLLHLLLLTRIVPDLLGRVEQERMIDIVNSEDGKSWEINSTKIQPSDELIGRVVEVLLAPNHSFEMKDAASLWDALFPDQPDKIPDQMPDQESKGEIVGISPPIYTTTHKSIACIGGQQP